MRFILKNQLVINEFDHHTLQIAGKNSERSSRSLYHTIPPMYIRDFPHFGLGIVGDKGGIRTTQQASGLFKAGADMIIIGTAFEKDPEVILKFGN